MSKPQKASKPIPPGLPPRDKSKFVGAMAEDHFESWEIVKMNVEPGFDFTGMDLDDIVARYKWQHLGSKLLNAGSTILVREFYANAAELIMLGNDQKSRVRGKSVDYSVETINKFFKMESDTPTRECQFTKALKSVNRNNWKSTMKDLIAPTFGILDPKVLAKGKVAKSCDLPRSLKFLHRFICERILPSGHDHEVNWKRALLLHLLWQGEYIDTGRVIHDEIKRTAGNLSQSNFNFPLLITALCAKGKVSMTGGGVSKDLRCPGLINVKTFVEKSHPKQSGEGSSKRKKVVEEEEEEESEEEEGEFGDEGPDREREEAWRAEMSSQLSLLRGEFGELRMEVSGMNQRQTSEFADARAWRAQETADAQAWRAQQSADVQAHWARQESLLQQYFGQQAPPFRPPQ